MYQGEDGVNKYTCSFNDANVLKMFLLYFNIIYFSEFCEHKNTGLNVSQEEIPKGDSFDFVLIPAEESIENEEKEENAPKTEDEDKGITVYCMDISGSMSRSLVLPGIQGNHKSHRLTFNFFYHAGINEKMWYRNF
jgi:hypothetical protein